MTMSSLEIGERTGKRHDHVMRDIRELFQKLSITDPSFGGSYRDSTGRTLPCYFLPKRECLILVTGYDVPLRAAVIDRWQELEAAIAKPAIPNFADPIEAAQAWIEKEQARRSEASHIHAMRHIRVMFQTLGESERKFASSYLAGNGKMEPC